MIKSILKKQYRLKIFAQNIIQIYHNDRIDIALASNADGISSRQDDLDLKTARKLLGPSKILVLVQIIKLIFLMLLKEVVII